MKKIITILLLVPIMATAQTVSKPINKYPKPDTASIKISDSTAVISLRDMNAFLLLLNRVPHEGYLKYQALLGELWNWKSQQKARP